MTRHRQVKQSLQQFLFIILGILLIGQIAFAQNTQTTNNKADSNLRSSARVNPSTLAMELSVSLGNYPGRSGNSIPVSINYSSKVWEMTSSYTHHQRHPVSGYQYYDYIDEHAIDVVPIFTENSLAGWTSSLKPVTVTAALEQYNSFGEIYTPEVDSTEQGPAFQVHRIRVQMANGSTIEFRKDDDGVYNCQDFPQQCNNNFTGTYLSVDGSGMRFERAQVQSNSEIRDVLYLPNGSRYIFPAQSSAQALSYNIAEKFIDKDGNITTYDSANRKWTDTLGREILDPLPGASSATTQTYYIKGINNANIPYSLVWKNLGNSLESSSTQLKYMGEDKCTYVTQNPVSGESLFKNQVPDYTDDRIDNRIRYLRRTRACAANSSFVHNPSPFNPVVLSEILLPNGQKYEFKYNEFGEITKITYPTGGYERFVYQHVAPIGFTAREVYTQANRGVSQRFVSFDGVTESQTWNYYGSSGGGTTIVAPDGSQTERLLYHSTGSAYGFEDPRNGMVKEEQVKDSQGVIRSRTLTDWAVSPATNAFAKRDPKPVRSISIIIEKDPANSANWQAIASMSETEYETPSQNGSTAPTDSTYFAHLNPKQVKTYHYLPISLSTAQSNSYQLIDTIKNQFYQSGQIASINQTDYMYNSDYRARGIGALVSEQRVLASDGVTVKAKTQFAYDEPTYQVLPAPGATTNWQDPETVFPGKGNLRANATTTKVWSDSVNNWIVTHVQYDKLGNLRKSWSPAYEGATNNKITQTEYSANYNYAYPTSITTPAPGTNAQTGATTGFVTAVAYDSATGLPISTTDPNGAITQMNYLDPATNTVDPLLRLRLVTASNGQQTITNYGAGTSEATRFVHTKTQIDATSWAESWTWFDGLGRTQKTQKKDSAGDVFVETKYDNYGRAWKISNPYRAGVTETDKKWTENVYDEASRLKEVRSPLETGQTTAAKVQTTYSLATTGNQLGTVMTVTDQAGKERRSVTNALGQLVRIDEPDVLQSNQLGGIDSPYQATVYSYDPLGNLKTVQQGGQTRSFVYDSLSRLKSATNPESGVVQYGYDANGNLTQKTDARGVVTTYNYDNLNRVLSRIYSNEPAGQAATPAANYYYDNLTNAKGKLIKVITGSTSSPLSITDYQSFDILGRVTQSQQTTDGTAYNAMTYTYNLSGALVEQKYPSGRVVKNVLDTNGDLSIVQSKKNANAGFWNYASHFSYTASGAVSSMQLGNGRWESTQFNNRLQPTQIALGATQNATNQLKLDFNYGTSDNNGNVKTQTITVPSTTGQNNGFTATQTYNYDSLNRLKDASEVIGTQTWKQTYKYDRFGNRRFDETTGATTTLPRNCATSTENPYGICDQQKNNPHINDTVLNNRLKYYSYDAAGNVKTDAEGKQFTYDGENKQTEVKNSANLSLGTYFYDADGRRVKKVVPGTGETTIFVYDASGKMVAEYSTVVETTNAKVGYLTNDHLGSPRIITDKNGNATSRRDFLPFGEEIGITIPQTAGRNSHSHYVGDNTRQKFTSYERDIETGLDFAQARMLGYNHGRFTSPDPLLSSGRIENPQTWNRYAYVLNNPLLYIDPLGLYEWAESAGGSATDDELLERSKDKTLKKKERKMAKRQHDFRQKFKAGLERAKTAATSNKLTAEQRRQVQESVDSYGDENVDNGVAVGIRNYTGGAKATARLNEDDTISVDFNHNLSGDQLAVTIAHEGRHVADAQAWVNAGHPIGGDTDMNHYFREQRAWNVSSYVGQGLNLKKVSAGSDNSGKSYNVWSRGWKAAEIETKRANGINNILTYSKLKPTDTDTYSNEHKHRPQL